MRPDAQSDLHLSKECACAWYLPSNRKPPSRSALTRLAWRTGRRPSRYRVSRCALCLHRVHRRASAGGARRRRQRPQRARPLHHRRDAVGCQVSESGWATFQGQCFGCHRNESPDGAPTAWSIRQLTPERIFESLAGRESRRRCAQRHSEDACRRVHERPADGKLGAGEAARCPTAAPRIRPCAIRRASPRGTGGGTTSPTLASSLRLRRG